MGSHSGVCVAFIGAMMSVSMAAVLARGQETDVNTIIHPEFGGVAVGDAMSSPPRDHHKSTSDSVVTIERYPISGASIGEFVVLRLDDTVTIQGAEVFHFAVELRPTSFG